MMVMKNYYTMIYNIWKWTSHFKRQDRKNGFTNIELSMMVAKE